MSGAVFEDLLEKADSGDPQSCLEVYSNLTDPMLPGYGRETLHTPRYYLKTAARSGILDAMAILGVLVLTEGDEDYLRSEAIEMLESAYQRGSDLVFDLLAAAGIDCESTFTDSSPLRSAIGSSDQLILDRILRGYLSGEFTTLQMFNWLRLFRSAQAPNLKLLIQIALKNPKSLSFEHRRLVNDINRVIAISEDNSGSPIIYASEKKLFAPYLMRQVINRKFPDRTSQQNKSRLFQYLSAMLKYFHQYYREIAVGQIRGELSLFNAKRVASIPFEDNLDAYTTNCLSTKTKLALYKGPVNWIRHYGGWVHKVSRQFKRLTTTNGDYRFDLSERFKDLPAALFVLTIIGLFGSVVIYENLKKDPDFNICETTYAKENKLFSGGLWSCAFDYEHRNALRQANVPSYKKILDYFESKFGEGTHLVLANPDFSELPNQQFDLAAFADLFKPNGPPLELFIPDEAKRAEYLKEKAEKKQNFLASRISEGMVSCSHEFEFTENGSAHYLITHSDGSYWPDQIKDGKVIKGISIPPRSHCFWLTVPNSVSHREFEGVRYPFPLGDPDSREVAPSKDQKFRAVHQFRDYLHSDSFPLSVVLTRKKTQEVAHQIAGYQFNLAGLRENITTRLRAIDQHLEPINRLNWWSLGYWSSREKKFVNLDKNKEPSSNDGLIIPSPSGQSADSY